MTDAAPPSASRAIAVARELDRVMRADRGRLIAVLAGLVPAGEAGMDFSTIEAVRAIFASDAGVTIGWTHYLAFDLFVGLWIARDADAKSFARWVQAPILVATFLAGPFGLFVWLLVRERRARISGRWK